MAASALHGDQMRMTLNKFNLNKINYDQFYPSPRGPTIMVIGRRGTGKSYLIKDILYHFRDVKHVLVISGSESANPFFASFVPKCFIRYEYKTSFIYEILARQQKINTQFREDMTNNGKAYINYDPRLILILDDCLYDSNNWVRDKYMRYMFMNGRHVRVMLIITMQYPLGILPELRTNVDYTFIFREPNTTNQKRIYENYAGSAFHNHYVFGNVLAQTTENHECMVIDNTVLTNNATDMVYFYRAKDHEEFRMCSMQFWESSTTNSSTEDLQEYNPSDAYRSRANSTKVLVHRK